MATQITFDEVSLQRDEIVTTNITDLQAPDRTLNIGKRGRDDFSTFISEFYDSKTIQVEGYLITTTASGLLGLEDSFKQLCSRTQKNLDITREDGEARRYVATAQSVDISMDRADTTQAKFSVNFRLSDPFASAVTSISGSWTQSSMFSTNFLTISGTYPARPQVRLDVLSGEVGEFRIENTTISGQLTATPLTPLAAGESMFIDMSQFIAMYDDVEMETSGVFPKFRVQAEGLNTFVTTISGNSFSALLTTEYTPKYI